MSSGSPRAIRLGPFELDRPIGTGGMGEVWCGRHVTQDVPVAVKVLTAQRARRKHVRAAFRNEVRAAASLNHRGVVVVFDHGLVPLDAERASGGRLLADSPYLAMELAGRGSLKHLSPTSWPQLRAMLLAILDALAHAHARGVIHRDLKPANVLVAEAEDGIRLKLSDFGIAHALNHREERPRQRRKVSGTPHYMAPEQVLGQWRRQGPWTDLYALGCVAWELAMGRPPFWNVSGEDLQRSHLHVAPPPLKSPLALPEGFQPWLDRLLAKSPMVRFRLAADAAWALLNLPGDEVSGALSLTSLTAPGGLELGGMEGPGGVLVGEPVPSIEDTVAEGDIVTGASLDDDDDTVATDVSASLEVFADEPHGQRWASIDLATLADLATQRSDPSILAALASVTASDAGADGTLPLAEIGPPPMPARWQRSDPPRRSMQLVGAGLGLYGLRPVPIVDRETERDLIWRTLVGVRNEGRARAIVLRGAAGNGKSRVAEWMTQRAHEVGAALRLRATHSPIAGPADGLPHMVADFLRCVGQSRPAIAERAARFVSDNPLPGAGDHDALALAELIAPTADRPFSATHDQEPTRGGADQLVRVRLNSPEERYAVLRRMLERLTGERPVIVWLDDVQWGSDALAFTRSLLETQLYKPLPVLVLLTVRDEALPNRTVETSLLRELTELSDVDTIEIDRLADSDQALLIEGLLGLDSGLARQVVARTAGNPLFAVQLVGDWVQRGVLAVGERGFHLLAGEEAPLPDDIHELWATSIVRVAHTVSPHDPAPCWLAIEVGAALGLDVIEEEWRAACGRAGVPIPDGLLDGIISNRLARQTPLGWAFVHGMVRESLERSAQEAHRWEAHHRACADMLLALYGDDRKAIAERLGRHLVAANALEEALDPLLRGALNRYQSTDFRTAHALLDVYFDAMARLRLPERDSRWGDGWVQQARIQIDEGRLDEAQVNVARAEKLAREYRWGRVLARAGTVRGYLHLYRGDSGNSLADFERAAALFKRVDDPAGLADCYVGLGKMLMWRRELDRAAAYAEFALELYRDRGDSFQLGHTLKSLGNIYQTKGDSAEAADFLERARAVFERLGNRRDVAGCLNDLGEIHRLGGDLVGAEDFYRRALGLLGEERLPLTSTFRLNLALVLIARDEYAEAWNILEELRAGLEASDNTLDLLWIYAALLPCVAGLGEWDRWGPTMAHVQWLLEESGLVDEDIPWCAEVAGDLAAAAGRDDWAREAYQLAIDNYRAAERDDAVAEVERRLDALDDETRRVT